MKKSIKFRKTKLPRIPKAPDLRELRGTLREINREMRKAREKYIRACLELAAGLRGYELAQYIVKVAAAMITCGLYSDLPTVGNTAYAVMLWFAHFEAGPNFWAKHRDWTALRGMTQDVIKQMRWSPQNRKRIKRAG